MARTSILPSSVKVSTEVAPKPTVQIANFSDPFSSTSMGLIEVVLYPAAFEVVFPAA